MAQIAYQTIISHPGYAVSDTGVVQSLARMALHKNGRIVRIPERIMRPYVLNSGYLCVDLYKDGRRKRAFVHKLVAEGFIPNPLNLPEVNHRHEDGDKTRNTVENLEWVTHGENMLHACRVLKQKIGEKHYKARLTEADVRAIRLDTRTYREVSASHGVSIGCIQAIRDRRSWQHIEG